MNKTALPADCDDLAALAELDEVMERDFAKNKYDSAVGRSLMNQFERAQSERRNCIRTGRFGEGGIEVVIKNIPQSLNENGVRRLCDEAGFILDVLIVPKPTCKHARVIFAEAHEAYRALELINGYRIGKMVLSAYIKPELRQAADTEAEINGKVGLNGDYRAAITGSTKHQHVVSSHENGVKHAHPYSAKNLRSYSPGRAAQTHLCSNPSEIAQPSSTAIKRPDAGSKAENAPTAVNRSDKNALSKASPQSSLSSSLDLESSESDPLAAAQSWHPELQSEDGIVYEPQRKARPIAQPKFDKTWDARSALRNRTSNQLGSRNQSEQYVEPDVAALNDPEDTIRINPPWCSLDDPPRRSFRSRVLPADNPHEFGTRRKTFDQEFARENRARRLPSGHAYEYDSNYCVDDEADFTPRCNEAFYGRPPSWSMRDSYRPAAPFCNLRCPGCMDFMRSSKFKFAGYGRPRSHMSASRTRRPYMPEYERNVYFDVDNGDAQFMAEAGKIRGNRQAYDRSWPKGSSPSFHFGYEFERRAPFEGYDGEKYELYSERQPVSTSTSQREADLRSQSSDRQNVLNSISNHERQPRPNGFGVSHLRGNHLDHTRVDFAEKTQAIDRRQQASPQSLTVNDNENVPFAPPRLHRVGDAGTETASNQGLKDLARNETAAAFIPKRILKRNVPIDATEADTKQSAAQVPLQTQKPDLAPPVRRKCFLREYPLQQVCTVRLVRFVSPSEFYVLTEDETRRLWLRQIVHTLNKHCGKLLQRSSSPAELDTDTAALSRTSSTVEKPVTNCCNGDPSTIATPGHFAIGDRVVVRSGSQLYRAVVEDVVKSENNRNHKHDADHDVNGTEQQVARDACVSTYKVSLIDSGQSILCNATDMCTLVHDKLWALPKLTVRCCLHACFPRTTFDCELADDIDEVKCHWDALQAKEARQVFEKHIIQRSGSSNGMFFVELKRVDANGVHVVEVRNSGKVSYAELLVALGVGRLHGLEIA